MKILQSNFTTPEQSKRLLALGVPADSADCYHDLSTSLHRRGILSINGVYSSDVPYNYLFSDGTYRFLPCWSVGRLMEIFDMCCIKEQSANYGWCSYQKLHNGQTYIDYLLYVFTINKMQDLLEFSKLEE